MTLPAPPSSNVVVNLQCRRATLSDRDTVIAILKTAFEGRDYLPVHYNHLIEDPNFVGVLGELNGEVVAFAGAYIINGGTTMMTKGSRVKEDLQGMGVYGKLWRYLRDTIRGQAPGLKYEEFTTNILNPILSLPVSERKYVELYRTSVKQYDLQGEVFLGHTPADPSVQEIGFNGLREVLNDRDLAAILFPERLIIDWHVYLPLVENMNIIEKQDTIITRTLTAAGRDKSSELVVFGSWYQCPKFLAYSVDCYGNASDEFVLREHLRQHALKAMALHNGNVRFLIFTQPEYLGTIDRAYRSLKLRPGEFFTPYCFLLLRDV